MRVNYAIDSAIDVDCVSTVRVIAQIPNVLPGMLFLYERETPALFAINIAIPYNCQYYFPSNIATAIAQQG
ncbi:hypothetical protein PWR63_03930 [Paraburkholderia sp. A2WS-5]|uniref:hypothetical protein n=1 Tax=Paraburkholderia sp. A2WS-5 TaxID=3028372 RepID=UPI003B79ACAE